MSLNRNTSTALIKSFRGAAQSEDQYNVDPAHGLYSENCDFIVSPFGNVQVATRRGTSVVATFPVSTGAVPSLDSWYFSSGGVENCYAVYYAVAEGVRAWNQGGSAFTGVLITQINATAAIFAFDGARLYAAFQNSSGRIGFAGGQVYGLGIGADPLFASPLIAGTNVNISAGPTTTGVVTAGVHRIGFIFTTRNGYVSALNPVGSDGKFAALIVTATGTGNMQLSIQFLTVPSYLVGGTVQVVFTSASNVNRYFLVAGATANVPASPGTVNIPFSISDNDLVEGTDVTQNQNFITSIAGTPPFFPSALFQYSSRMAYVTIDSAGFPVIYFSDKNAYQAIGAFSAVYLEGRQIPVMGASLGGTCYIGTLSGLYSCQDNSDVPATWTPPAHIDGSVGILAPSCMIAVGGKILMASEKGLFLFRGGSFPQIPLSYWQSQDWNRINWPAAYQVQIVDDSFDKVIRVLAPLKVAVTGASNTNPIEITTQYPHLLAAQAVVTIAGVNGNTNANGFFFAAPTGPNTFTVGAAGNGAYSGGGMATPANANAIMTWAYPDGDDPGEPFYSIHGFSRFTAGAMATVRNIATGVDETWFARSSPTLGNAGPLLRRVLPTDSLLYRDIDYAGQPTAINALYETSLVPGQQDEQVTIHDFHGTHMRVTGSGDLNLTAWTLDHSQEIAPVASPIALSTIPGREILVKWACRSEQESFQFGTDEVDQFFIMVLLRLYYTQSLLQR